MSERPAETKQSIAPGPGAVRVAASNGIPSDRGVRVTDPRSWLATENADVLALSALLLLTAAFGRPFSRIGVGDTLFVSEVVLVATLGLLLVRVGVPSVWRSLRSRMPITPLIVLWLLGSIATVRGLEAHGLSMVIEDVGLFEYSVLLPLVVLIASDRRRLEILGVALLIGAVACTALFVANSVAQRSGLELPITLLGPASASGMYISFFVIWVGARALHGIPMPPWQLGLAGLGLLSMWLTNTRSIWVVLLLCVLVLVAFAPRARLPVGGAAVIASAAVTFAAFFAIDHQFPVQTAEPGVVGAPTTPQVRRELRGLGGGTSEEGSNVAWRIDYWGELVRRAATDPGVAAIGAGFGEPIAFTWNGRKYDFRDGDPRAFGDVSGPHNSFVHLMYRMGVPALLAVLALLGAALARAWPLLRPGRLPPARRAELVAIVGALVSTIVVTGFNDALEGPFLGIFFWAALGLLFAFAAIERSRQPSEG